MLTDKGDLIETQTCMERIKFSYNLIIIQTMTNSSLLTENPLFVRMTLSVWYVFLYR